MLHSQTYDPVLFNNVWDDPVLRRAAEIEGGAPRVEMRVLQQSLPAHVQEELGHFIS